MVSKAAPRAALVVLSLAAVACTASAGRPAGRAPAATPTASRSPIEAREPYPFTTPVPPRVPTPLDGTYGRTVSTRFAGGPPVPCRRCPPYRIDSGRSTLELRSGRFWVAHHPTGFRSSGHFSVSGHRVLFFNDANCTDERGVYGWSTHGASLVLEVIEDRCAFGLRARYLTALPWSDAATGPHPVQYFNLTDAEAIEELRHLERLAGEALRRRDTTLLARAFTRDGAAGRRAAKAIERLLGRNVIDKTTVDSLRTRVVENDATRVVIEETRIVFPCLVTEGGNVVTRVARAMRQTVTWELGLQNITWLIEDAVIERSERMKTQPPTCR